MAHVCEVLRQTLLTAVPVVWLLHEGGAPQGGGVCRLHGSWERGTDPASLHSPALAVITRPVTRPSLSLDSEYAGDGLTVMFNDLARASSRAFNAVRQQRHCWGPESWSGSMQSGCRERRTHLCRTGAAACTCARGQSEQQQYKAGSNSFLMVYLHTTHVHVPRVSQQPQQGTAATSCAGSSDQGHAMLGQQGKCRTASDLVGCPGHGVPWHGHPADLPTICPHLPDSGDTGW